MVLFIGLKIIQELGTNMGNYDDIKVATIEEWRTLKAGDLVEVVSNTYSTDVNFGSKVVSVTKDGDYINIEVECTPYGELTLIPQHDTIKIIHRQGDKDISKKVVKSIKDLEIGMTVRSHRNIKRIVVSITGDYGFTTCTPELGSIIEAYNSNDFSSLTEWSYSYNDEYLFLPISKLTEAELKIKELEATIQTAAKTVEEANKQLQELKGLQ